MNFRSPLELTVAVLVVLVGLLIGGMFAVFSRGANQQTGQSVAVTSTTTAVRPSHRVSPTTRPAVTTPVPTPQPTAAPTAPPTAPPTTPPTASPTVPPATTRTATAAVAPAAGVWRIEEANVQVGTIVWSGSGAGSGGGNAIALDVHKESVAGHGISACERHTTLHVVLSAGAAAQTVPYREVNCSGATSTGEMRVSTFSADGRTFSGSFWSDGAKLGDFTAART